VGVRTAGPRELRLLHLPQSYRRLTHNAARNPPVESRAGPLSLRFLALSQVDLENLGRSAELARKAVREAPFRVTLIGANGQTAATSVMRVT
jgi:hypothetical protein